MKTTMASFGDLLLTYFISFFFIQNKIFGFQKTHTFKMSALSLYLQYIAFLRKVCPLWEVTVIVSLLNSESTLVQLVTSSELKLTAVVSVGFGIEMPNLKSSDFGPYK